MPLEVAYSFNDVGNSTIVLDQSGKERHLVLTGTNGTQVAGGHDRGALGKTGATMPVLPAAVLAACQTDDRTIMVDYQSDLTTWIVRFDDPTFGSGMWGLLNLGSPNAVQGQVRDNSGSHNLMTRPSATAPGAVWHNYCLTYVRATGVASIYRDGVFVVSQTFTAGTQLSTSATAINIAEWTTTGPSLDNLRLHSHALSPADVASLANTPVVPDSPIVIVTGGFHGPGPFGLLTPWQGVAAGTVSTGTQNADASLAVTGTVTSDALSTKPVDGSLTSTAALSGTGTTTKPVDGAIAGSAALTASASLTKPADSAVTATAGVTAAAQTTKPVDSSLSVTAGLTGSATSVKPVDATVSATVTLTATVSVVKPVDGGLTVTAGLTASATVGGAVKNADVALTVSAGLVTTATVVKPVDSAVTITAAVTPGAAATKPSAAAVAATAGIAADASLVKPLSAAVTATAGVTADATTGAAPKTIQATQTTTASLVTAATLARDATGSLTATVAVTATASVTKPIAAGVVATAAVSTLAAATHFLAAALSATAGIDATGEVRGPVVFGQMTFTNRSGPGMEPADRDTATMTPGTRGAATMSGG